MELLNTFSELTDPRTKRITYSLELIIFLTISSVVSGAENWTDVANFSKSKIDWVKKFYPDLKKTPSHDTFGDFFKRLEPDEFSKVFIKWVSQICNITEGELIAIDGKKLRGSYDNEDGKAAIHIINVWASENELVLGQKKVDSKSNEITAIPELLKVLEIKGAVISIDAMGCQKEIAKDIIEQGADYVLALKKNQKELFLQVESSFESNTAVVSEYKEVTKGHGRIETRICKQINDLKFIEESCKWKGIKSVIRIESTRYNITKDKEENEIRYYISSLDISAKKMLSYIRGHWHIENKLHWQLDVNFKEDDSRIRKGHGDQNFSLIRKIALNLLKADKEIKKSIRAKMKMAGWNDETRELLLQIIRK